MNQEQLQRFCAPEGDYRGIDKPIRRNGYIFATNGHLLVRVTDNPDIECATSHAELPTLESIAQEVSALTQYKPLQIQLPAPSICSACNGHGKVNVCNVCDGKGEFRHGCHDYDCKECDGGGRFASANGTKACTHCDGTGYDPHQRVIVEGDAGFARHYLSLLMAVPGIEFSVNDKEPENGIAGFRFEGGIGALMPVRKLYP